MNKQEEELRQFLKDLCDGFGEDFTTRVVELGRLENEDTAGEFIWRALFSELYWLDKRGGSIADALGIDQAHARQLVELVERELLNQSTELVLLADGSEWRESVSHADHSEWATEYYRGRRAKDVDIVENHASDLICWVRVRTIWCSARLGQPQPLLTSLRGRASKLKRWRLMSNWQRFRSNQPPG